MKQKFIYMLSVAAALWATACSDDMGIQDIPVESGKGHLVKVGATMASNSRMAIENGGSVINYYWTADDAFTVFDFKHSQQTEFVVDKDSLEEESPKASFIGTPEIAYEDGQTLYAVYNKKDTVTLDANGNVELDLTGQDGRLSDKYQYMWGEAIYSEGESAQFLFRHLVTTLQVKLRVPEGVNTLSDVRLYSDRLVSKATLVLNEAPYDSERQFGIGDLVYSYTDNGWYDEGATLALEGTFTPEDGYVTLYFYTLSAKEYYDDTTWNNNSLRPSILFTDENGKQYVSVDYFMSKETEVGAVYALEIENTLALTDFANEATASGSSNDPYQIANADQFFTLMMRNHLSMKDRNNERYYNRSYQLTDDIELDTRSVWYPIRLLWGNFDGNGKTVSGNMSVYVGSSEVGLFGEVYSSTIQDLTLSAHMDIVGLDGWRWGYAAGMLVGQLERSDLKHCFVTGKMTAEGNVMCGALGGLVGNAGYSQIEFCGFSGTIVSDDSHGEIGGIVGSNNSWSTNEALVIKGCYSDGSITTGNKWEGCCYGGIIGRLNDPQAVISYCWSTASMSFSVADEGLSPYMGGIVGYLSSEGITCRYCYWNEAVTEWTGYNGFGAVATECASFEDAIPTDAQLAELNKGILASGYLFSEQDGRLESNSHTVVPPSDIENW